MKDEFRHFLMARAILPILCGQIQAIHLKTTRHDVPRRFHPDEGRSHRLPMPPHWRCDAGYEMGVVCLNLVDIVAIKNATPTLQSAQHDLRAAKCWATVAPTWIYPSLGGPSSINYAHLLRQFLRQIAPFVALSHLANRVMMPFD